MYRTTLPLLLLLGACSSDANHLGNPLMLPVTGLSTAIGNTAYAQRRGAVELVVKTNHAAILTDIRAGGGPVLQQAMDTARIPPQDQPARVIQMQRDIELYSANPGALVVALMVYGG